MDTSNNYSILLPFSNHSEVYTVAGMIAMLSLCGMLLNILCAVVMFRLRSYRNAFGLLTATHALSNGGVLAVFLLWAFPTTLLNIPPSWDIVNNRMGSLSIFFQTTSFHANLCISVNRFCAIYFPSEYRRWFNLPNTGRIIVIILIISTLYWSVYFFDGCDFYYAPTEYLWNFASTPCGMAIAYYIDFAYCVAMFVFVGLLDIATLIKLHSVNARLVSMNNCDERAKAENTKRNKKEALFFIQSCTNTSLYGLMIVCFHVISTFAASPFQLFLTTTFAWGLGHASGGVIIVLFNADIRIRLVRPSKWLSPQNDSTIITVSTKNNIRPPTTLSKRN